MEFDHHRIILDEQMLHVELCSLRKNLVQFGEGAFSEGLLAEIVTSQRVSAHDGPVDVVGHMLKEGGAVAGFKPLENCANAVGWKAACVCSRRFHGF